MVAELSSLVGLSSKIPEIVAYMVRVKFFAKNAKFFFFLNEKNPHTIDTINDF